MNILIIGLGAAGKFYLDLFKKDKKIKKIYVIKKLKMPPSKQYKQISIKKILNENLSIEYAFICSPSYLHYYYADICLRKNMSIL